MNFKNMLEMIYFHKLQKSYVMLCFLKFIIDKLFSYLTQFVFITRFIWSGCLNLKGFMSDWLYL